MKVKEVMTASELKYCSPQTKLREVAKKMEEGNCGLLPVIDTEKKVIGIVTDRDICLSLAKEHSLSHSHIPVSDIMSSRVYSIHENADLNQALKEMRINHVSRLPVVDDERKLSGVLSIHNLFTKSLVGNKELSHLSNPSQSVVKTVKALSDRYALRRHPEEPALKEEELELPFVF